VYWGASVRTPTHGHRTPVPLASAPWTAARSSACAAWSPRRHTRGRDALDRERALRLLDELVEAQDRLEALRRRLRELAEG
jgi:hypothetical protein